MLSAQQQADAGSADSVAPLLDADAAPAPAQAAAPGGGAAASMRPAGMPLHRAALELPLQNLASVVPGQQLRSVVYRSPVRRCIASLKFSKKPGSGELRNSGWQRLLQVLHAPAVGAMMAGEVFWDGAALC